MLKLLERTLKSFVAPLLRALTGSAPVSIPQDDRIKKILVVRQHNQLGDMLCVVPLLRSLRSRYPNAFIALLASPVNGSVMLHNRYIDRVILYDKNEFLEKWRIKPVALVRFLRELRKEKFDIVLVPSTVSLSFTSDLLGFFSGASIHIGAGKIDGRENRGAFLFHFPVDLDWSMDPHRHQTLRNWDISAPLKLTCSDLTSEITLLPAEVECGRGLASVGGRVGKLGGGGKPRAERNEESKLGGEGKQRAESVPDVKQRAKSGESRAEGGELRVAFHPGAGKIPNQWPAERFAAVANQLVDEFGADVFITKGPMDQQPVEEMMRNLKVQHTLVDCRPVREVAAILSQMQLVISNDTGIMHVAAAVGVPVLSLFGPTDPHQWAPVGGRHRFLQASDGVITTIVADEVLKVAREMLRADSKL